MSPGTTQTSDQVMRSDLPQTEVTSSHGSWKRDISPSAPNTENTERHFRFPTAGDAEMALPRLFDAWRQIRGGRSARSADPVRPCRFRALFHSRRTGAPVRRVFSSPSSLVSQALHSLLSPSTRQPYGVNPDKVTSPASWLPSAELILCKRCSSARVGRPRA